MSLSIALTKGRLEKQTVAMLEELGYGIEALKDKGRALVFKDSIEDQTVDKVTVDSLFKI
ncbi:hypothetical protein [Eubacterium sp. AF22-8LB]|uniref:hypothetical protein n=1 Tax=Eubacterium sp. AF22-8LB TaxID=2292232 RepID=UPI001FA8FA67|nr:hypothetical protein [Eubacterium sp. AF22-8LB]